MSNNVLGTDMLLKPPRKERSACPGVVAFNDNVKGTEERQRHRERESGLIDYKRWDRSRSPKMLSIPLVIKCLECSGDYHVYNRSNSLLHSQK